MSIQNCDQSSATASMRSMMIHAAWTRIRLLSQYQRTSPPWLLLIWVSEILKREDVSDKRKAIIACKILITVCRREVKIEII